ncbi:MAG: exodeoxyribonuclease VII large subunit [Acidobacteria bacterium]|nr:exodeoxyribonuclease VII large subunit [Acidobacteriota bacterium]
MNDSSSKLMAALFAEQRVFSVSELTTSVKDLLESEFYAVQVQGEISNYKRHTSGHWYFTLKDNDAQLRAVFFRQWNRLLRFQPENGLEVRLRGRLSVYEPRGEYQILVETLEPVGVGALQLAFEQQVKKLAAEGLFDEARKRPLPRFPRRIGVITSPVGAALHDLLQILERRNRGVDVLIAPVRVQGVGAAREIADAIRLFNQYVRKSGQVVDVLIVGRGGGSLEDLWAFNEEQVARAIYESDIPVVSAVGHETDYTIADFVADLRAPTPSAAAELVVPDSHALRARLAEAEASLVRVMNYDLLRRKHDLRELVDSQAFRQTARKIVSLASHTRMLEARAGQALQDNLKLAHRRLRAAEQRLAAADFRLPLTQKSARLQRLEQRLAAAIQRRIDHERHQLALYGSKLDALSPLSVLGRGYALVKDDAGQLVSRAAGVSAKQHLTLRFEDGEIGCQVE